jgi:hypothetical protein
VMKNLTRVPCAEVIRLRHPLWGSTRRKRALVPDGVSFPWRLTEFYGVNCSIQFLRVCPWCGPTKLYDCCSPEVKSLVDLTSRALGLNEVEMCEVEFSPGNERFPCLWDATIESVRASWGASKREEILSRLITWFGCSNS